MLITDTHGNVVQTTPAQPQEPAAPAQPQEPAAPAPHPASETTVQPVAVPVASVQPVMARPEATPSAQARSQKEAAARTSRKIARLEAELALTRHGISDPVIAHALAASIPIDGDVEMLAKEYAQRLSVQSVAQAVPQVQAPSVVIPAPAVVAPAPAPVTTVATMPPATTVTEPLPTDPVALRDYYFRQMQGQ